MRARPEGIALTWEFGGIPTWVTVTLTPDGTGTRLELEHVAHLSPHWDQYGPGAVASAGISASWGLSRHLAEPECRRCRPRPSPGGATTEEAKDMMRATSDDWGRAAIASGDDREHALKAAEATRRFYSGEPPMEG